MDTTHSTRTAVLCTTADYYRHFRAVLLRAQRSVFIAGWDFQPDLKLVREDEVGDDYPVVLSEILAYLANERPDLQIRIASWNYSLVYEGAAHQVVKEIAWARGLPKNIGFALDHHERFLGAHHHKVTVIDDTIAFTGGVDLSIRRWDRDARLPKDPRRVDPRGAQYDPIHDVQMIVEGDAAAYLGSIARKRWLDATGERFEGPDPRDENLWPEQLRSDFTDIEIDFARTWPRDDGGYTCEIENVYAELFQTAQKALYVENQYLSHEDSLAQIGALLQAEEGPEIVIVVPHEYRAYIEMETFGIEKARAIDALRAHDRFGRLRVVTPQTMEAGARKWVYVHSKLGIADDRMLVLGSANLSDRSMGLDTELVAVIRGHDDRTRSRITAVRERLLSLHLGLSGEGIRTALAQTQSLVALVDMVAEHPGRALIETPTDEADRWELIPGWIADPPRPIGGRLVAGAVAAAGVLAAAVGIGYLVRAR